jgi:hypothetical protein
LKVYGGSKAELLKAVYPEIDWNPHNFAVTPKNAWKDDTNMLNRSCFFLLAQVQSFEIPRSSSSYTSS